MAITVVQTSAKQTGDNITTFNFNFTGVAAQSNIFVLLWAFHSGGTSDFISVSDGDGKYNRDVFIKSSSASSVGIFRLTNVSAGTHSITINLVSSASFVIAAAIEVSSSTPLVLDQMAWARGTSTTPSSGATLVTKQNNEFIAAVMSAEANQASITVETTSPVWVQVAEELNFSTHIAGESDRKIVSSAAAYTANWTLASSAIWAAIIATYVESGSGGGGEHSSVF